jgi:hypothetical protein
MQDLQQVCPANRVEGLGNVKLNEETGGPGSVELLYPILHIEEVVVDASGFNESSLVLGDEVGENRCKTICQELGEDLRDAVNQANGAIVGHRFSIRAFGDKHNVCRVDEVHVGATSESHSFDDIEDVLLNDFPAGFEEIPNKTVGARSFDRRHGENSTFDLIIGEVGFKLREVMWLIAKASPVDAFHSGGNRSEVLLEMNMKLLLLVFLGNSYPTKSAERLDVKFLSSGVGSYMKELIVCVSGLDPG